MILKALTQSQGIIDVVKLPYASIKPSSRVKTSMATKNFIGEQVSPFIDDKLLLPSCVFINYCFMKVYKGDTRQTGMLISLTLGLLQTLMMTVLNLLEKVNKSQTLLESGFCSCFNASFCHLIVGSQ